MFVQIILKHSENIYKYEDRQQRKKIFENTKVHIYNIILKQTVHLTIIGKYIIQFINLVTLEIDTNVCAWTVN